MKKLNSKRVMIFFSVLLCVGCNDSSNPKNDLVTDGKFVSGTLLPTNAHNKEYLGNGWFRFELNGRCFLLRDRGRSGLLANIDCT